MVFVEFAYYQKVKVKIVKQKIFRGLGKQVKPENVGVEVDETNIKKI